jgi:HK97 family phage major capsid protein
VTAIVETIAHYINITRRAAADAGQLRTYVDQFLMYGLMDTLNDQIINGTGTTPQLVGLDDLANTQAQAYDTSLLITTRRARTLVNTTGGATPSAYVFNPLDWEDIDLLTDNENRYYFGGPARVGTPVLWGLPVVEDEAVAEGQGYVGDWSMGIIWDREQARIYMTDSHSDFFIRNILTLLAEMRVAVGWLRPAAFVEIDLVP